MSKGYLIFKLTKTMSIESIRHTYNIANLLTASNLICGVLAIILIFAGRIDWAPFLIYLAAIFDFLDGFLARKLKANSELGKQLDSLADLVTFGVAPGLLTMVMLVFTIYIDGPYYGDSFASHTHFQLQNWLNALFYSVPNNMDASIKYLPFIALLIPFFSMFRLAKFNLDKRQLDSFIGLPTPLNALFFTFFPLILWTNFNQLRTGNWKYSFLFDTHFLSLIVLIMSLMLVAKIPLFSLKFKNLSWKHNQTRFIFLIVCVCLSITMFVWAIPMIVFLYFILSVLENNFAKKHQHEI